MRSLSQFFCIPVLLVVLGPLAGCGGEAAVEQGGEGGSAEQPIPCGATTCASGQLCLWPPSYCDYSSQPPEVIRDDQTCVAMPASCAGQSGDALVVCLRDQLCTGVVTPELSSYEGGLLNCGPAWYDCF